MDLTQQLADHAAWIANPANGKRLSVRQQAISQDFTSHDMTNALLAHCDLSGSKFVSCKGANFAFSHGSADFSGADITGTSFEGSSVNLVGAKWNGITVTRCNYFETPLYRVVLTDAFIQLGCKQKTLAEWEALGKDAESIKPLGVEVPGLDLAAALAWWKQWGDVCRGKTPPPNPPAVIPLVQPVPIKSVELNPATKAYLQTMKYLTCIHRGEATGESLSCNCSIDRVIYQCGIHVKCLKRLPSATTADSFGDQLNGVTICAGCNDAET